VQSIVQKDTVGTQQPAAKNTGPSDVIKQEMQTIQDRIQSDPKLINGIQSLTQDKELMRLLADPELLKALLSYDPKQIEQNEAFQKLLANPKLQELLLQIKDSTPTAPPQE